MPWRPRTSACSRRRTPREPRFPDLIEVQYTIKPAYKNPLGAATDGDYVLPLELPITTPPAQIPKIVSAGIALSPYVTRNNYSETEPRRRYLWIEFAEPVHDPKDTYFARVLGNAPDQLISNNSPELLVTPDEPALPIDPEPIRVITFNQSNDDAGLDAMQPMEMSNGADQDANRFYLLPLPAGLHPESPEMFGFFTYEIRVGHYRYTDSSEWHAKGDAVWTCAAGALRPSPPRARHPASGTDPHLHRQSRRGKALRYGAVRGRRPQRQERHRRSAANGNLGAALRPGQAGRQQGIPQHPPRRSRAFPAGAGGARKGRTLEAEIHRRGAQYA